MTPPKHESIIARLFVSSRRREGAVRILASIGCVAAVGFAGFEAAYAAAPIDLTTPPLAAKGAPPASAAPAAPIELKTPALAAKGAPAVAPVPATVDPKTGTIDVKTPPLQATGS